MRLNKYIARSGVCSRRKADELIFAKRVRVNGKVVTEPGREIFKGDFVEVDGRVITGPEKHVYYALNKPCGYVVSSSGTGPFAIDLLEDAPVRVYPVGRLDVNTSGLLLFTNDGDFANKVMHPSSGIKKTYVARLNGRISEKALAALRSGIDIGGYKTRAAEVSVLENAVDHAIIEITISEGKNRQIRRMAKAVGLYVKALERIAEGPVKLGRLKEGGYRKLTPAELLAFKSLIFRS